MNTQSLHADYLLPTVVDGGLVDWLLSCSDKGYFAPIESESTDTL